MNPPRRTPSEPVFQSRVASLEELRAHYDAPLPRALAKEQDHISPHYRKFIEYAPFAVLATCGPEGLDCSPRGDVPGTLPSADEMLWAATGGAVDGTSYDGECTEYMTKTLY